MDVDDVKMAVQMQCEQNNTAPPSREVLLELSQSRYCSSRGYQLMQCEQNNTAPPSREILLELSQSR